MLPQIRTIADSYEKEQIKRLIEYFVAGTTARVIADLVGVNSRSAAYYFYRLREIITHQFEKENKELLRLNGVLKRVESSKEIFT